MHAEVAGARHPKSKSAAKILPPSLAVSPVGRAPHLVQLIVRTGRRQLLGELGRDMTYSAWSHLKQSQTSTCLSKGLHHSLLEACSAQPTQPLVQMFRLHQAALSDFDRPLAQGCVPKLGEKQQAASKLPSFASSELPAGFCRCSLRASQRQMRCKHQSTRMICTKRLRSSYLFQRRQAQGRKRVGLSCPDVFDNLPNAAVRTLQQIGTYCWHLLDEDWKL